VLARVLAEDPDNYNDYLWGEGYVSPDYPHNGGWYWDHWSGTPEPLPLNGPAPTSLPVYQVVKRTIDQNYVKNIGSAFGLTDTTKIHQEGARFYMVDVEAKPPSCYVCNDGVIPTKYLEVFPNGAFFFKNLGELWTNPKMTRTLPNSTAAQTAADTFIRDKGHLLPGTPIYSPNSFWQGAPTVRLEGVASIPSPGAEKMAAGLSYPTNYAVDYGRSVAAAGQQLSVVGPGSRYNVYVGNNSAIVGLHAGWRDLAPVPATQADQTLGTTPKMVSIKTADQAWADFLSNPSIALAPPPFGTYDRTGKAAPTLAYYEQSAGVSQAELIPVWVFVADVYTKAVQALKQSPLGVAPLLASDVHVYVPAAFADTALPQASITSPAAGTKILSGLSLGLQGAAGGGTAPYSYQWSSSVDGDLGTGPTVNVAGGLHPNVHNGNTQPNKIILSVTDANGMQATATVDVTVLIPIYLPLILR
jgi:hypothetical protein